MKAGQKLWTTEELILAINLYYKLEFGKMHSRNPEVQKLAALIDRTPGSVAYKLVNFASLDPGQKARGIKGAENTSKLDRQIWNDFYHGLDSMIIESEYLLAKASKTTVEKLNNLSEERLPAFGSERDKVIKDLVEKVFFQQSVLAAYNHTCCITKTTHSDLLVAAEIVPWLEDDKRRLSPRNGLAINRLHAGAFNSGLISITPDLKVRLSPDFTTRTRNDDVSDFLLKYSETPILPPQRFGPDPELISIRNQRYK